MGYGFQHKEDKVVWNHEKDIEEEEDKGMPSLVAPEGLFTQDRWNITVGCGKIKVDHSFA